MDLWRSDAAALVRGFKHDAATSPAQAEIESLRVEANGHPQIDAPTPYDYKVAIAAAIRSTNG